MTYISSSAICYTFHCVRILFTTDSAISCAPAELVRELGCYSRTYVSICIIATAVGVYYYYSVGECIVTIPIGMCVMTRARRRCRLREADFRYVFPHYI